MLVTSLNPQIGFDFKIIARVGNARHVFTSLQGRNIDKYMGVECILSQPHMLDWRR